MNNHRVFPAVVCLALAASLTACATDRGPMTTQRTEISSQTSAQTFHVIRRGVAEGLYELAFSARENTVFAASAGRLGDRPGPASIYRLSPGSLVAEATIDLPLQGFGLALDDADGRLYVGHSVSGAISVIDTATNTVTATLSLMDKVADAEGKQRFPHHFRQLLLQPDRQRLYLPGLWFDDSALYVVDTAGLKLEKVIPGFGPGATGIALDAAGQRLFVSNLLGQLFEVDTRTLTITGSWDIGADQPLNLEFDSESGLLYAVDQGLESFRKLRLERDVSYVPRKESNRVVIFDPAQRRPVASLSSGEGPVSLLRDAVRHRLFVTNRASGTVTIFDTRSRQLLHTVALPVHPNSLTLDALSGAVFVTIKNPIVDGGTGVEDVVRIDLID